MTKKTKEEREAEAARKLKLHYSTARNKRDIGSVDESNDDEIFPNADNQTPYDDRIAPYTIAAVKEEFIEEISKYDKRNNLGIDTQQINNYADEMTRRYLEINPSKDIFPAEIKATMKEFLNERCLTKGRDAR